MPVIFQRRVPSITTVLIALTLGMSIVVAIDAQLGGDLYYQLSLLPRAVWQGQVWRLATWPFIQGGPIRLILACVVLYVFGSDLLVTWGSRRYLRYLAIVVLVAGVGTSLLALVLPGAWRLPHLGGMVLGDAILIAWGRQFPHQLVSIYLVLVVPGRTLVWVVVDTTLLFAVFFGIAWLMPELLGVAAALLYMSPSVRRGCLNLQLAWTRRKLRVVREPYS